MSKMNDLSYDIEQLYIDGVPARRIAELLAVDLDLVLGCLESWSVRDQLEIPEFDPRIQFLQPTIQFAEKQGYRVTLNPQGRVVAKLVNKQLGHTVHIGQFQPSGKGFEVSMADNLDWQTNAWSAKELARDFKGWHERAVKDQDFNNGYNEKPQLEQQGVADQLEIPEFDPYNTVNS